MTSEKINNLPQLLDDNLVKLGVYLDLLPDGIPTTPSHMGMMIADTVLKVLELTDIGARELVVQSPLVYRALNNYPSDPVCCRAFKDINKHMRLVVEMEFSDREIGRNEVVIAIGNLFLSLARGRIAYNRAKAIDEVTERFSIGAGKVAHFEDQAMVSKVLLHALQETHHDDVAMVDTITLTGAEIIKHALSGVKETHGSETTPQ